MFFKKTTFTLFRRKKAREPLKQRQKPEREPGEEEGEGDREENDVGLPLLSHQTWLGNSVLLKPELT